MFLCVITLFISSANAVSEPASTDRYSYEASSTTETYQYASQDCLAKNSSFVAIFTNEAEFERLKGEVGSNPIWIGLQDDYDDINRITFTDFPGKVFAYQGEWATGEPNFSNETCVVIDSATKKLMDFGCSAHWVKYVCMKDWKQDGNWEEWGEWSECNCSSGNMERSRSCDDPEPLHQGADCVGNAQEGKSCPPSACSVTDWSSWGGWSDCAGVCQAGTKTRSRTCGDPMDTVKTKDCVGSSDESAICPLGPCPGCDVGDDPLVRVDLTSRTECENMGYCYNSFKYSGVCFMKKAPDGKRFIKREGYIMKSRAPLKIIENVSRTMCTLKCRIFHDCMRPVFELQDEVKQTGRCYLVGLSETSWKPPKHFEVYAEVVP